MKPAGNGPTGFYSGEQRCE